MSDSIKVAIKVRPLIKREKDENLQIQWAVVDNVIVPVDPEKKRGESAFQFDHIFDPEKTNSDVFETVVRPIVDAAVNGFNGTVFAYGQTSSGKTHTMLGTLEEPGIIPMAIERMFDAIADTCGREFLLRVSYLEIYNEKVNDLLDTTAVDLKLREDSNGLVQVMKCKEEISSSPEAIMAVMKKGDKNRSIGQTDMNERSSRSHTIFRITIESRDQSSDSDGAIQVSQLNLVDLAGSERARQTNATGERFKEGTHINMSLSTLGLVIKQLSESTDPAKFVNFRDSKLTRLLQASLGGNAMTTIICAVTPAAFEETQCTLSFASRAKSVKNKPQLNEVMSDAALLKRYKRQLAKLNEELERLKNENRVAEVEEMESKLQEKEHKLQETDRLNQILEERIGLLKNGIISVNNADKNMSNSKIPKSKRRRTWAGDGRALSSRFSLCPRNLPTIEESTCISPEKKSDESDKFVSNRRRKSIFQSVDLNNESFETAFADFELELIKVAKERDDEETDITIPDVPEEKSFRKNKIKSENRVKFQDDVEVCRFSSGSNWSDTSTPDKRNSNFSEGDKTQDQTSSSPGTPKSVLRERLKYLTDEYNSLQEFTTLERQMLSAQKGDYETPTERMILQKQIDDLIDRLGKYNRYQTELEDQLTVSFNCINGLSSRAPDILELWSPTIFSDNQGEVDPLGELKKLEQILTDLKNNENSKEKPLTELEKKLTNDYNECLKELEKVKLENEVLTKENSEIKNRLQTESTKLKNSEISCNTLRTDTDCLMEKLILKNAECAKLKERVVEFERIQNEINKSISANTLDISVKNEEVLVKRESIDASDSKNEFTKINEKIQQHSAEIIKCEKNEEEIKLKIEHLQESLNVSKIEKENKESQTTDTIDKDAEISKLLEIIHQKTASIIDYQKLETEMKKKIEELQQCTAALDAIGNSPQDNQKDLVKENASFVNEDTSAEISKLSDMIQQQSIQIENYKKLEEEMKDEIKRLQIEKDALYSEKESNKLIEEKDEQISKLQIIIEEKSLEIDRLIKNEEENRKEIERLQSSSKTGNLELKTTSESEGSENIAADLSPDKINEIAGLLEIIKLKSTEIETLQQSEAELKKEVEKLQKLLEEMEKAKQIILDSQQLNSNEIATQKEMITEKSLEIEKYKYAEEEMQKKIDQLQQYLNEAKSKEVTSTESQTEFSDDSQLHLNEIAAQKKMIAEKSLEMEKYKHAEEEMQKKIDQLQQYLNEAKSKEVTSAESQTEFSDDSQLHLNEIAAQKKMIAEKSLEMEKYKHAEEEMQKKIDQLQQYLNEAKSKEVTSAESQTEFSDDQRNSDDNQEKDKEIERYKQIEKELKMKIEQLQDSTKKVEDVFFECESEATPIIEETEKSDNSTEKDVEIVKLSGIVEEMTLEITNLKQAEENLKKEVAGLRQRLESENKLELVDRAMLTDEICIYDKRKIAHEMDMYRLMDDYKDEIDILKSNVAINVASTKLEAQIHWLHSQLMEKIQCVEQLIASNSELRNSIEESSVELSKLQNAFEQNLQQLDVKQQQIDSINLEKHELKDKINSLTLDFEKQKADLGSTIDKLKTENDELKKHLQTFEAECSKINVSIAMQDKVTLTINTSSAPEELTSGINESSIDKQVIENESTSSVLKVTEENEVSSSDAHSFIKPDVPALPTKASVTATAELSTSDTKSQNKKFELESSSIFANMSYFDNMEVGQSFTQDSTSMTTGLDESRDISTVSTNIDTSTTNQTTETKTEVIAATSVVLENSNVDFGTSSLVKFENESFTAVEYKKINIALEKENARLRFETEEVQKVLSEFKQNLEELQQTINILTNENIDMSNQLTRTRENNYQVVGDLQSEIDILRNRLSSVTEEKISIKNELVLLHEQCENMRASTPVVTDDEVKNKFFEYQEKIKALTDENIELSTNLMEKIEELEKVKESKVQLYEHECTYREKCDSLVEKLQLLEKENIELSSDLTEQIEECDKLKETADILKQQLEAYANQQSVESSDKDDLDFVKQENQRLTNELIDLRAKITQLSRENANLSSNLAIDNSDEHEVSVHGKTLNLSSDMMMETSTCEGSGSDVHNASFMANKVKSLQEQVDHLTLMNKKLSELKLTNCSKCAYLKELSESRRLLKLEVKSWTQKHSELQKKYEQMCADSEAMRSKAKEDINTSMSFIDTTLNGSINEGLNVTVIEEKVHHLYSQLEEVKENHSKLSNQYKEKCTELEKLQHEKNSPVLSEKKESRRSKTENSARMNLRVQNLQKDIDNVSNDLHEIKKSNSNINVALSKYMTERNDTLKELETYKSSYEELKRDRDIAQANVLQYQEKVNILEEELATLYKQIETASASEKMVQAQNLEAEVKLESLTKEKFELANSLKSTEEKFQKELEQCNIRISAFEKDKLDLQNEVQKLEDIVEQLKKKNDNYIEEKLKDEIQTAKSRIVKELRSLSNLSEDEMKALMKKSVTDIFLSFLNVIVSKETEIIKRINDEFEKTKRKLEEEKQQCIDAEKRTSVWSKTVEADLEKLQGEFTEQEHKNRRLQGEIHRIEDLLKEAHHENQQLHNTVSNLEADINALHIELDKKSKNKSDHESAISAAQEIERLARTKEEEWMNRLRIEKEEHVNEINELNVQLDSYKSTIEELKGTIEGLDMELEHMKSTVGMKTNDFANSKRRIEELQHEMEKMDEIIQTLKIENAEKNKHVDDITGLLKIKCDMLTEYKTKVETMKPEYESLQAQITERKLTIEKLKEEIHNLKMENKKQLDVLQDKLSDEEIKSAGLTKQLNELKNKNTALCTTIEEFRDRVAELERDNANLQRKVRNSTSKVRVENEMQELQDENRSLKNHLEGSYNRIKELQETKSQVQRELTEAEVKNGLLEQELETTKIALASLREKYNATNVQKLREKNEALMREKHNIILDVEEKRMMIASKDQQLVECQIAMETLQKEKDVLRVDMETIKEVKLSLEKRVADLLDQLDREKDRGETFKVVIEEKNKISGELEKCKKELDEVLKKNKELDEEMDDMVSHIHKQESEIADLQDRLITGSSNGNLEKLKLLEDENEKLKIDLRVTEVNREKLQKEIVRLNADKEQLFSRIEDMNGKIAELETKNSSRNSSKSNSPTSQKGRRRRRRSDLYNQNRNLELESDSRDVTDIESPSVTPTPPVKTIDEECRNCSELRNRIREMSLDLVARNNKITMLEVQLQSENFPYQLKCNELQSNLLSIKAKYSELKLENQKLQRALMKDSSRDCQICRQNKFNKRDQGVQVNPESKISLTGMSSGIVEDHLKLQKMEKERNWMKDLCRSRAKKIKDLEQRIRQLEGLQPS